MEGFSWNELLPIETAVLNVVTAYAASPNSTKDEVVKLYGELIDKMLLVRQEQANHIYGSDR